MLKKKDSLNRTPPIAVRRELRKEVGFGCPVPDCGNPYLYWHHFDPSWSELKHHDPKGMIALCGEHHSKADAGAFTKEQLRKFKSEGAKNNRSIIGRFDWMRNRILAVVGGGFFYETYTIVQYKGQPTIWLNRDENGYLLLNVLMLSTSGEPRLSILDNYWISTGNPLDIECPPNGKLLKVKYENGDELKIEFIEIKSKDEFKRRYPEGDPDFFGIEFPITAVEVFEVVADANLDFSPKHINLFGIKFNNFHVMKGSVGISID